MSLRSFIATFPPRWLCRLVSRAVLGSLSVTTLFGAAGSRDSDIKAAFLYNFITFTDWPETAFPSATSPFVIGVIGDDPFGPALNQIVTGEKIKQRSLLVQRIRHPEAAARCHILFISSSEDDRLREILRVVGQRPVLTVSDLPGFVDRGGTIGFSTGTNVRLLINPEAARRAGLTISSKLLRLSRVVDREAPLP